MYLPRPSFIRRISSICWRKASIDWAGIRPISISSSFPVLGTDDMGLEGGGLTKPEDVGLDP